jgi:hypothetical protein
MWVAPTPGGPTYRWRNGRFEPVEGAVYYPNVVHPGRPPVGPPPLPARAVGESGDTCGPTLVPREVKLDKPLTFSGNRK